MRYNLAIPNFDITECKRSVIIICTNTEMPDLSNNNKVKGQLQNSLSAQSLIFISIKCWTQSTYTVKILILQVKVLIAFT